MVNKDVTNPHFQVPFVFREGSALCVEQNSDADIMQCANAIARTPRGYRLELPEFGVQNPILEENGPSLQELHHALDLFEPRARYLLSKKQFEDILSSLVTIGVETNNG